MLDDYLTGCNQTPGVTAAAVVLLLERLCGHAGLKIAEVIARMTSRIKTQRSARGQGYYTEFTVYLLTCMVNGGGNIGGDGRGRR